MTAREREHKHTLGRTSAGHSPQRRIRSQRSSSIYIADFYLRVTSPSARVLDQPVCNKASPKVADASPKNVQEWCSPSCWPRIDFGPLYLKSEYMISPVHLPIKAVVTKQLFKGLALPMGFMSKLTIAGARAGVAFLFGLGPAR